MGLSSWSPRNTYIGQNVLVLQISVQGFLEQMSPRLELIHLVEGFESG